MLNLYLVVLVYALFRAIRGLVRTKKSLKWVLLNSRKLQSNKISKPAIKLYILIPMLREQEIVAETFKPFHI